MKNECAQHYVQDENSSICILYICVCEVGVYVSW